MQEAALATEAGFDATFVSNVPLSEGRACGSRTRPRSIRACIWPGLRARCQQPETDYEHSAADEFSDDPRTITSNGHTLSCDTIVLATHTPLTGNTNIASATLFQTKLALYTSYVVAGRVRAAAFPTRCSGTPGIPIIIFVSIGIKGSTS